MESTNFANESPTAVELLEFSLETETVIGSHVDVNGSFPFTPATIEEWNASLEMDGTTPSISRPTISRPTISRPTISRPGIISRPPGTISRPPVTGLPTVPEVPAKQTNM